MPLLSTNRAHITKEGPESGQFPSGHNPPKQFPLDNSPLPFLHGVGRSITTIRRSTFYTMKRATVNMYKSDRGGSVRVRSTGYSASFQIFANCPEELSWACVRGNVQGGISYTASR